jgi:hypothetical protein
VTNAWQFDKLTTPTASKGIKVDVKTNSQGGWLSCDKCRMLHRRNRSKKTLLPINAMASHHGKPSLMSQAALLCVTVAGLWLLPASHDRLGNVLQPSGTASTGGDDSAASDAAAPSGAAADGTAVQCNTRPGTRVPLSPTSPMAASSRTGCGPAPLPGAPPGPLLLPVDQRRALATTIGVVG